MARWHRLSLMLAGMIVLGLFAALPESWGKAHEHIGVVLAVQGTAEVRTRSKPGWEMLKFRDHIFLDETIRTHTNGKIKLLLRNDSIMTLSENSEIHITEFLLNDQQHRSIISLVVGKVRVLTTKLFGRADAMEVKTPNTVAGIRSSEEHVTYNDQTDRTTVFCVSGHCYIRDLYDPAQEFRIPEGHITEHIGAQFPSVTRRVSLQEHRRSVADHALTIHDPRELPTEPEAPEEVQRPPRREPHPREDDERPPPGMRESEEPEEGERHHPPHREDGEEPRERDEEPRDRDEEPRERDGEPRDRDGEPRERDEEPREREEERFHHGEEPPPPDEGPPPLPGEWRETDEELPPDEGPFGEEPFGDEPLELDDEPPHPDDEPPPPPPPPPPAGHGAQGVITPDTSPARPTSLIRLLIRIPPGPNAP